MLINEVCKECNLTKKAVEYYTEQGLIQPRIRCLVTTTTIQLPLRMTVTMISLICRALLMSTRQVIGAAEQSAEIS